MCLSRALWLFGELNLRLECQIGGSFRTRCFESADLLCTSRECAASVLCLNFTSLREASHLPSRRLNREMSVAQDESALSSSCMADREDVSSCHPSHGPADTESTTPRSSSNSETQPSYQLPLTQSASSAIDQSPSRASTGLAPCACLPVPLPSSDGQDSTSSDVPPAQVSSCSTHVIPVSKLSSQSPEPHRDEPMVRDGGESNHAIKSESNDEARSPSPRGSLSQGPSPGDEAKECSSFKRKSFLERNRKAAQKCRLRKKEWCASLEAKVKYLESVNESLQNTVISFRSEIVCLQSKLDELQQQLQQQQQFQHQHVHRAVDVCLDPATHHAVSHGMHLRRSHDGMHTSDYPTLHEYLVHSPHASPSPSYAPYPSIVHTSEPLLPSRMAPYSPLKRGFHSAPPKSAPDSRAPHRYAPSSSSSASPYAPSHLPPLYMPSRGPI